MKPAYNLVFQDREFPIFILPVNLDGEIHVRTIGTESLQDFLMLPDMSFRNKEAEVLDENIFFYIPDAVAKQSENDIIKFIENNIY